MPGHEILRSGTLACAFRIQDRRKPRRALRLEWQGARSIDGHRMRPGSAAFSYARNWRSRIAQILGKAAAAETVNDKSCIGLSALQIDVELERLWRGGRLRPEEADLLFAATPIAAASKTMVSAVVPAVGAFFLVRALSDGHVEAIPFGPLQHMVEDEVRTRKQSVLVFFTGQVMGPGYLDPRTDTVLADLAALRPFETALKSGDEAPKYLAELLFGPVNALIGGILERETGPRLLRLDPGGAMSAAITVAGAIIGKTIIAHWQPPASTDGYPRLDGIAAIEGYLSADEENIVQALFMAAAERVKPEFATASDIVEPDHPWAPRLRPSYRFLTRECSSHAILADVALMGSVWQARRHDPAEAWRFHRMNGQPMPHATLARIDGYFGAGA